MKIKDIQPIPNEPALLIDSDKILVIADLHIGIETELKEYGLIAPSKTKNLMDHIFSLCEKYQPRDIILLGDIKHNIPSSTRQERREVIELLNKLKSYGIVHILPGNHDGNIRKIAPKDIVIHPSDGLVIRNVGFVHGHRWPNVEVMKCDQIILAHTHPTIMLIDRLNYKTYEPCWLIGKFTKKKLNEKYPDSNNAKIIVIPAFNKLCGGIAVNCDGVAGPIGKIMDIQNAEIFLLDGSSLGKVKNFQ